MNAPDAAAALDALAELIADRVAARLQARAPAAAPAAAAEFLSEKQAARRLGFSARTLEGWRREDTGPKYRQVGRAIRYAVADLDAFDVRSKRPRTTGKKESKA